MRALSGPPALVPPHVPLRQRIRGGGTEPLAGPGKERKAERCRIASVVINLGSNMAVLIIFCLVSAVGNRLESPSMYIITGG